ncbi:MAG: hypothetical protein QOH72_30 [Solirubrobacteraceae bacterium]|nr:hypothetical protein [Solirubrobacteraceae bacterium]
MRLSSPATRRAKALRAGLFVAALAGVAALVAATLTTVIRITVGTTTRLASLDTELSGWDRHGPALLVVAGFAVVMLPGALRGARPAMMAVLVCGAAALAIALALDVPHLDDTGQVGELYSNASAGPQVGFWLEACGGALLVVAGGGLLAATGRRTRGRAPRTAASPAVDGGGS